MMDALDRFAPLVARVFLGLLFGYTGTHQIIGFRSTAGFMATKGFPIAPVFLAAAIVLQIGGALSVLLGLRTRWGLLALILFLVPTTLIFHDFWTMAGDERFGQTVDFLKNSSIVGGLLVLAAHGPGPWSLDARTGGGKANRSS